MLTGDFYFRTYSTSRKQPLGNPRLLWLFVLASIGCALGLIAGVHPVAAGGPSLDGVGGMDAVYNPYDGYIYVLNSNDSVSLVEGTRVVKTIDLPTGSYSRLTDLDVASNGDVYVLQWFYDQAVVLRDGQLYDIVPRQRDDQPGSNGIENGPLAVTANPVNGWVYVATHWSGEPSRNGVTVLQSTEVVTHVVTGTDPAPWPSIPTQAACMWPTPVMIA